MSICTICKKTSEETTLYPGILASGMVNVCEECAEDQKIPIIKKPSESQLTRADKTYSVRERLDRMSGRRDTTEISRDQTQTQRNLSRLKMPKPKQNHPEVLENYYWTLNMARRRVKMTTTQLANKINTTTYVIQEIEKGIIPQDFKTIFLKLEALLGIKLLKVHEPEISFTRKNKEREQEILAAVSQKMKSPKSELEENEKIMKVQEKIEASELRNLRSAERREEEIKLSKRKDLHNVTLNDLVDRKRAREKYQQQVKQNEMMGDDLDLDEL
ncbi:MAG: hypothetical protein V1888_01135 [archaeon]